MSDLADQIRELRLELELHRLKLGRRHDGRRVRDALAIIDTALDILDAGEPDAVALLAAGLLGQASCVAGPEESSPEDTRWLLPWRGYCWARPRLGDLLLERWLDYQRDPDELGQLGVPPALPGWP